ncbi:proline-rich proteoglycan 2-like [Pan troglodytes]|uniref:proline-rich proteoglycan 2-like n=1 Tax=Pan troglodytes TaxID=9598 RepID=UPI0023F25FEA|nr:proline-rich proteoglycan 2-like [Pan troglodytes]
MRGLARSLAAPGHSQAQPPASAPTPRPPQHTPFRSQDGGEGTRRPRPPGSLCALAGGDARPDGPHRKGSAGTEETRGRGPGRARGSSPGHRPQRRGHPRHQHPHAGHCLPTAPRTLRTSGAVSAAPCAGPELANPDCNCGPPTAAQNAQGRTERQPRPSAALTTPFFPPLLPPREGFRQFRAANRSPKSAAPPIRGRFCKMSPPPTSSWPMGSRDFFSGCPPSLLELRPQLRLRAGLCKGGSFWGA